MESPVTYQQPMGERPTYVSLLDVGTSSYDQTTSSSNTTWHDVTDHQPSIAWLITVPLVVGSITIITVVGNALVMVAYSKDKRINGRVASLLILNLAISDLIIGLVVLSVNLAWITWNELLGGDFWLLGEVFCKLWLVIDNTASMLSVFTIILISLDRYWLLTKKMHYQSFQTRKRVLVTISLLWVSTASVYTLIAVGWPYFTGERSVDYSQECELDMTYNVYATIMSLVCEFLIPLTVIIALNSTVYVKIRNRAKGLKELGQRKVSRSERVELKAVSMETNRSNRTSPPVLSEVSLSDVNVVFPPPPHLYEPAEPVLESSCVNCTNNVDDHQTLHQTMHLDNETGRKTTNATAEAHKSKREYARHLRAAIVLAVLVSVFIACWLPYQIVNVINAICDECVSDLVWEIVNNILWCNSFVNPFLYAATNVHFRRNFIILLGLRRFRCFRSTMHVAARPSSTADRIRPRFRHQQQ